MSLTSFHRSCRKHRRAAGARRQQKRLCFAPCAAAKTPAALGPPRGSPPRQVIKPRQGPLLSGAKQALLVWVGLGLVLHRLGGVDVHRIPGPVVVVTNTLRM